MAKVRRSTDKEKKSNGLIQAKHRTDLTEGREGWEGALISDGQYEKLTKDILNQWRDGNTFKPNNPLPLEDCPEDPWESNYDPWDEEKSFELGQSDSVLSGSDADIRTSDEVTKAYEDLNQKKPSANVNGFYKSFRYVKDRPFRGKWGIFFNDDALHAMATRAASYLVLRQESEKSCLYHRANELVTEVIYAHEFYHYRFDHYAQMCEHILGRKLYQPLKDIFCRRKSRQTEESLANQAAWGFAHCQQVYPKDPQEYLNLGNFFYQEFKRQPNAYAEFDRPPDYLRAILAAQLHEGKTDFKSQRRDLEPMVAYAYFWSFNLPFTDGSPLPRCPVYHLQSKTKGGRVPKHLMVFL